MVSFCLVDYLVLPVGLACEHWTEYMYGTIRTWYPASLRFFVIVVQCTVQVLCFTQNCTLFIDIYYIHISIYRCSNKILPRYHIYTVYSRTIYTVLEYILRVDDVTSGLQYSVVLQ